MLYLFVDLLRLRVLFARIPVQDVLGQAGEDHARCRAALAHLMFYFLKIQKATQQNPLFLSLSHLAVEHAGRVLALPPDLRQDGVEVDLAGGLLVNDRKSVLNLIAHFVSPPN